LAAGVLAATATVAQPPEGKGKGGMRGRGMQQGGVLQLLNNESVRTELHITDDQKDKLKTFVEEQNKKLQDKMADLRGGCGNFGDPEFQKKMAEEGRKFAEEAMKELKEKKLLDDKQVVRLKQITWQQAGPQGTVNDEEVQKVVKLTGEQKDKFKTMTDEYMKDMRELRQAGGGEDAQKTMEARRKEMKEKSIEVLTADQVKAWKELVGKEFEIKQEAGGGRRPGGKRPEKKDPPV